MAPTGLTHASHRGRQGEELQVSSAEPRAPGGPRGLPAACGAGTSRDSTLRRAERESALRSSHGTFPRWHRRLPSGHPFGLPGTPTHVRSMSFSKATSKEIRSFSSELSPKTWRPHPPAVLTPERECFLVGARGQTPRVAFAGVPASGTLFLALPFLPTLPTPTHPSNTRTLPSLRWWDQTCILLSSLKFLGRSRGINLCF